MTHKKNNFPKVPLDTTGKQRTELLAEALQELGAIRGSLSNMLGSSQANPHAIMWMYDKAVSCEQNMQYLQEALVDAEVSE